MSDEEKPVGTFRYWKLAIWKAVNGAVAVGIAAYIGATSATRWVDMHAEERVLVILGAWLAVSKFLDGFFDQTIARLTAGRNGNGNGNGNGQSSVPPAEAPKV